MPKRWFCGLFCGLIMVGVMSIVSAARAAGGETVTLDAGDAVVANNCNVSTFGAGAESAAWDDNSGTCVVKCKDNFAFNSDTKKCEAVVSCEEGTLTGLHAKTGYIFEGGNQNNCIITLCMDEYELRDGVCVARSGGSGTSGGGGTTVTADCGKNLFNPQLLIESGLTSYNTSTYTFTGRFTRDYSTTTKSNTGDFTGNHYMAHYSYGLVPNTEYELVYTIKCDADPDDNTIHSYNMLMGLTTKTGNATGTVAPTVGECSNGVATVTATAGGNGTSVTGVYIARATGVTKDFSGELSISKVMLVLSGENTSTMIPYGPCIKISTKKSTETRATGVESRLSNLRTMIDHLITRTQTNATNVGTLNTNKTTRPADEATDDCQTGDSCLLIKDVNGANHWYKIETCDVDSVLANVGNYYDGSDIGGAAHGAYIGTTRDWLCEASFNMGCQSGEWAHSYENAVVFGEARAVAISERGYGQIVSLPSGVQSGDVCVCRATAYRARTGSTGNSVYGDRVTINPATSKWFVISGGDAVTSDDYCVESCASADYYYWPEYYADIANSCTASAPSAHMCRYYPFFATAASASSQPNHMGMVVNGGGSTACGTGGYFENNAHCSVNGSWIVDYEQNSTTIGYVYGTVGYATVPTGTSVGDVIDMNVSNVSGTGAAGNNAIVCVAQGYKAAADASETNVTLNKVLVVGVGDYSSATDPSGASRTCADMVGYTGYNQFTNGMSWYQALSNICVAY